MHNFSLMIWVKGNDSWDCIRKVWRYNQKPQIGEWQTTQWPREKGQNDKQRSTKHGTENKWSGNTNLTKTWGELRCSGRVISSWSTSGTLRITFVINPVISHERGKVRIVITTNWTYRWQCDSQKYVCRDITFNHAVINKYVVTV
jgi:hypothetical protein